MCDRGASILWFWPETSSLCGTLFHSWEWLCHTLCCNCRGPNISVHFCCMVLHKILAEVDMKVCLFIELKCLKKFTGYIWSKWGHYISIMLCPTSCTYNYCGVVMNASSHVTSLCVQKSWKLSRMLKKWEKHLPSTGASLGTSLMYLKIPACI